MVESRLGLALLWLASRSKPFFAGSLLLWASLGCKWEPVSPMSKGCSPPHTHTLSHSVGYFALLQGALLVFFIKPSLYRKIIELTKTWWAAHLSFLPGER